MAMAFGSHLLAADFDSPKNPRVLIYSDGHSDLHRMGKMFRQAQGLDIDFVIGGGDLTNGRSLGQVEASYKFVARQLWWLKNPPYDEKTDTYHQSPNWIEIMGNKEEYGFLRPDRKNFGRRVREIVSKLALVPDIKPDQGYTFDKFNGFKIYISHMPVSTVPLELRGNVSEINLRNILWPFNWPLPFLPGPEPSTRSAMAKDIHPADVDLVVFHHLHVAGYYRDPETGALVASPGSASRNKSPEDQKTASFIVVDTGSRDVTWYEITDNGKPHLFQKVNLDNPRLQSCQNFVRRIAPRELVEKTSEAK